MARIVVNDLCKQCGGVRAVDGLSFAVGWIFSFKHLLHAVGNGVGVRRSRARPSCRITAWELASLVLAVLRIPWPPKAS